jgi:hypothetical protein
MLTSRPPETGRPGQQHYLTLPTSAVPPMVGRQDGPAFAASTPARRDVSLVEGKGDVYEEVVGVAGILERREPGTGDTAALHRHV